MTRVADTSALYALFSDVDRFHRRAVSNVGDPDPLLIPTEILVETIDLLAYRFGSAAGRSALASLLRLPHVSVAERVELPPVRRIYERARGRLSLADCFVIQTCVALGADPLAYDKGILAELKQGRP